MLLPPADSVTVLHSSDLSEARRLAKAMAAELGFDAQECEEIVITISELASNLVKHAAGGQVTLVPVKENERLGIKIETRDRGYGIADVEQAITDGFSTTGSLGYGLGTVNRFMDEFEIQPRPDGMTGTQITCLRWRREPVRKTAINPFSSGVATRAYRNMELNGDAFAVRQWNNSLLIGLIDGLGHGQFAHQAAQAAREYIENHYDQPLEALFRGAGRACRATRGVVMALARLDWETGPVRLTFASIGNIEARVSGGSHPMDLIAHRGVVGLNAPDPVVMSYDWSPDCMLVLHTDGLDNRWRWHDFPEMSEMPAAQAARHLLQKLGQENDDATVIVLKKKR